jgi:geranylgeranyl diphosphate synthase type 3
VAATINCANYIYFHALRLCHGLGNPQSVQVFVEELLNLHRGQGFDILWRDQNTCPSESEYKRMVLDKTGGLLRLATRLMATFSSHSLNFLPLIDLLSLYYQIRDDYINLQSAQYMENKSYCEGNTNTINISFFRRNQQ